MSEQPNKCPATGKSQFKSEAMAKSWMRRKFNWSSCRMSAYPCSECRFWHLGELDELARTSDRQFSRKKRKRAQ